MKYVFLSLREYQWQYIKISLCSLHYLWDSILCLFVLNSKFLLEPFFKHPANFLCVYLSLECKTKILIELTLLTGGVVRCLAGFSLENVKYYIITYIYKESWASKNWCFWTVVLEKTLESPLDCKEIQPVSPKGNQSWICIERTDAEAPILWPPNGKNWLHGKDPDAGKDWRQKKGTTEDKMLGWYHWLNRHEFE